MEGHTLGWEGFSERSWHTLTSFGNYILDQDVNGKENSRAEELKKSNLNETMVLVFLSFFHPLSLAVFDFLNELKSVGTFTRDYIGKWKFAF